ncbi:MAG TPA: (2Fe-2S)-binding protein [Stellaceae bacterium]|nr:(2Fe-2S)-binding protein [Stellaceae bacterium]
MKLCCAVNGERVETDIPPRLLLADFIRHELKLTGTHVGCEIGVCGACTVIVDGVPVRSCLMFAIQADGSEIRTVESLAREDELSPLQVAFSRHHALQCGFCTPGILMVLQAVRERNAWPRTEKEARDLLSGHLCRCTGYQGMVDAILELAS